MSPIFGLFLIMATAAHGSADSDSDIITHHVALGRPAFIQLINGTSGHELTLNKDGNKIFIFKKDNITFLGNWGSQFNFYTNGTLMITNAERSLSDIYTLDIFDSNGKALRTERFRLTIEEPVTPPALSSLCLPHGELRVSCSSAGDNPQYSWHLDGLLLNNSRPVYNDGKGAVILGKNTSGNLTCTAKNNISEEKAAVMLPNCAGLGPVVNCTLTNGTEIAVRMNAAVSPSLLYNMKIFFTVDGRETLAAVCNASSQQTGGKNDNHSADMKPMLFIALGTVVLLLVLTVGVYSYCRKRPHVQAEESKPGTEEMTYAQVTFNRNTGRREKRAEPEVVYGEVRK